MPQATEKAQNGKADQRRTFDAASPLDSIRRLIQRVVIRFVYAANGRVVRGCSGPSDDTHVAPVNQSRNENHDRKVGVGPRDTPPQVLFPSPPIEVDQSVVAKIKPAVHGAVQLSGLQQVTGIGVLVAGRQFSQQDGEILRDLVRRQLMIRHGAKDLSSRHAVLERPSKGLPRIADLAEAPHGWVWGLSSP
jgi:hypothetical protein